MAGFDREPIGADRSQEYRMKIPAHIFIDDLGGIIEGGCSRRHERGDAFHAENRAAPLDSLDGLFIAIVSGPGPVLVVQECRTVKGGGNLHSFIAEIQQDVVCHARKVGADDDIEILSLFTGQLFGSRDDVLDHIKGEQRLSALKFKRHVAGGAVHHHRDGPIRGGSAHIEFAPSRRLPGYLAVFAGMFAAKGHDKDVQFGSAADVVELCPDFGR